MSKRKSSPSTQVRRSSLQIPTYIPSSVPTLVQVGYAVGLLFITPLGDLVQRRQLVLILICLSASLTIGLAITNSLRVFEALTCVVGFVSVVPQILVPFAADLAPPERKASAVAIIWSSLMLGVLLARLLSGVIANFSNYKNVYWMATGLQFAVLGAAYFIIPNVPRKNTGQSYFSILRSMSVLAVTEPVLVQAAIGVMVGNM
jgi:predicted MFS family arabinose efflux permease